MILSLLAGIALALSFGVDLGHRTRYFLGAVLVVCIASAFHDSRIMTMVAVVAFVFALFALIVDGTTRRFSRFPERL